MYSTQEEPSRNSPGCGWESGHGRGFALTILGLGSQSSGLRDPKSSDKLITGVSIAIPPCVSERVANPRHVDNLMPSAEDTQLSAAQPERCRTSFRSGVAACVGKGPFRRHAQL